MTPTQEFTSPTPDDQILFKDGAQFLLTLEQHGEPSLIIFDDPDGQFLIIFDDHPHIEINDMEIINLLQQRLD